jgi:hypothetical protein
MKKLTSSKTITILVLALIVSVTTTFLLFIFSFLMLLERNASNRLLDMLALARPGIKLTDIKGHLGSPMHENYKLEDMIEFGPIKDKQFCIGKKLYSFYAVTPNCRAIYVYTDANGMIIHATWHDL